MAGTFAGTDSMFHRDGYGGTESHFGIAGTGFAKQWQDTDYRADANYEGNHRIISIETADMGESFMPWSGSSVPPWTAKQLDKIVEIVRWCCDTYDIPKVLVADSSSVRRGIAYHRQGIDGNFPPPYLGRQGVGEQWSTTTGKPCPGDARIRQLIEIVIPRVRGEEDDDMAWTQEDWERMSRLVDGRLRDPGNLDVITDATLAKIASEGFDDDAQGSPIRQAMQEMARRGVNWSLGAAAGDQSPGQLKARLDALEAKLTEIGESVSPASPPAD